MNNASSAQVMPAVCPGGPQSESSCATPDKTRLHRGSPALSAATFVFVRCLLVSSLLALAGCATDESTPVASDAVIGDYDNACLPEAVIMAQALRRHGIKARVLIMSGDGWSHAVTVYQYPADKGQIWCWDSDEQSVPVSARWTDSEHLARAWLRACQREDDIVHARYE
jgi:hypothetical protein